MKPLLVVLGFLSLALAQEYILQSSFQVSCTSFTEFPLAFDYEATVINQCIPGTPQAYKYIYDPANATLITKTTYNSTDSCDTVDVAIAYEVGCDGSGRVCTGPPKNRVCTGKYFFRDFPVTELPKKAGRTVNRTVTYQYTSQDCSGDPAVVRTDFLNCDSDADPDGKVDSYSSRYCVVEGGGITVYRATFGHEDTAEMCSPKLLKGSILENGLTSDCEYDQPNKFSYRSVCEFVPANDAVVTSFSFLCLILALALFI